MREKTTPFTFVQVKETQYVQ